MNILLTLSLCVVIAGFAEKVSANYPPLPSYAAIIRPETCKDNCTALKSIYDNCCKYNGKFCENACQIPKYEFYKCKEFCEENPKWACKFNCTAEKADYDYCCKTAGNLCGSVCEGPKYKFNKCKEFCEDTKTCPPVALPKETCKAICSFGPVSPSGEKLQQPMLCDKLCGYHKPCPEKMTCCPTACGLSCQKTA